MDIKELEKELAVLLEDLVKKREAYEKSKQLVLNKMDDRVMLRFDEKKRIQRQVKMLEAGANG